VTWQRRAFDASPLVSGSRNALFAFNRPEMKPFACVNVLEHIEDDQAIFKALSRKLKVGGRMFIYVPAFHCLWTSLDDKLKHFRRYRRDGLERLAHSARLCVRESGYVDTLGFLAALVFKVIGNKKGDLTPKSIHFYDRHIIPPSKLLDHLFRPLFGKNVYLLCEKNRPQSP
jgi:hypothetical protein